MEFLKKIHSPADLKKISPSDFPILANEIRDFMHQLPTAKQGHLLASLGVVELTIALHYVFDTPNDTIIFDVGHQTYPHKILTQRKEKMHTLRKWGGISGFPKTTESPYDAFTTGHSSTSISVALGKAVASAFQQKKNKHIAVIGDASLGAGMAFEALNTSGEFPVNMLIIINDNQMGIDPTIGSLKTYLNKISHKNDTFFNALQLDFLGSIDGHNFNELLFFLQQAKNKFGVQILHIKTQKGKGYLNFQKNNQKDNTPTFSEVLGETLVKLAADNEQITVISPAMISGSSLTKFQKKYPNRTFDVGIAEQHALTFSAGLASNHFIPFCVIYASFLQRAYDQFIHDIALQNLPVVLCIDRAGLIGEDGATHQGVFDISFLQCIPNLIILSPRNGTSLQNMLYTSQSGTWKQPIIIRYPKANTLKPNSDYELFNLNEENCLQKGGKYAILSVGYIAENVEKSLQYFSKNSLFSHYNIQCIKPLNEKFIHKIFQRYSKILVVEENSEIGGFFSTIAMFSAKNQYKNDLFSLAIPDIFIEHGSVENQQEFCKLSSFHIQKKLNEILKN